MSDFWGNLFAGIIILVFMSAVVLAISLSKQNFIDDCKATCAPFDHMVRGLCYCNNGLEWKIQKVK